MKIKSSMVHHANIQHSVAMSVWSSLPNAPSQQRKVTRGAMNLIGLILTSMTLHSAPTLAETTQCTPILGGTTTGVLITSPGVYCLTADMFYAVPATGTPPAIRILRDDVTLDLNGHTIKNTGTTRMGSAIYSFGIKRAHIKNGTIIGFNTGISLDAKGGVIEQMRLVENFQGITVKHDEIVRNNTVVLPIDTINSYGISVHGIDPAGSAGAQIIDNSIISGSPLNNGRGIMIWPNYNTNHIVSGNKVTGGGYGIYAFSGTSLILNNQIAGATQGIVANASSKLRGNFTAGCQTPISGGIVASGDNN